MAARAILDELAERTGWNTGTMLDLLCEYIDNQMSDEALEDFLTERADAEAAETALDEEIVE